MTNTAD